MSLTYSNLIQIMINNLNNRPNHPALFYKKQGIYHPITYQECVEQIKWLSLGISELGISPSDRVAILCSNRPEWVFADFAILANQAVVVPIYLTLSPSEITHILNSAQVSMMIVEQASHLELMATILPQCPSLTTIITIERPLSSDAHDIAFKALDDVINLGKQSTSIAYDTFLSQIDAIPSDQLASIVYTSGTTGEPKGVMLTHGNFLTNIYDISLAIPISDQDVVLSFLPLSHVFERTAGYYCVLHGGGSIYYAESIDTVAANMLEVNPTVVVSVPRLYEKMYDRIQRQLVGIKQTLFSLALPLGSAQFEGELQWWQRPFYTLADRLLFKKIRNRTGTRLRFFVSGGAPLNVDIARFFGAMGFTILEGYGLTETSPVIACNRPNANRLGTVGKALASLDIRLASDGELLVKGGSITQGYWKNTTATQEVFDTDGYFHTGDIAQIDPDGYIKIVDRKKDIIVLSNGKNVAPQWIEAQLNSHPIITQSMVIGDQHSYLVALIVPDYNRLNEPAIRAVLNPNHTTPIHEQVFKVVQLINQRLARFQQIKQIAILPTEWSVESGELTPSLKLRRNVISKQYESIIHQLYKEHPHETSGHR